MSEPAEPVHILLVDDRPGNLLSLAAILNRPDYELVQAANGDEALRLVLRHDFAVILLDVAMPGMDGFEVATTIKQRERLRVIPIIFVTASIQNIEWIFRAYSVGAVDFLHKPLDPHAVRAKVAVFVELFRQRQQIRRQASELTELRVHNLAEAIPHIVWTAGPSGSIDYFNRRWFDTTGAVDADSYSARWWTFVHEEDSERFFSRWREGFALGEPFQEEFRLRCADGGHRWHMCRALREHLGSKDPSWIGTFTDIEEQKRAQQEFQAAIRLRDEFLSIASHELRTPLSALQLQLQSAERLLGAASAEELRARLSRKLKTGVRQTERLATLVDALLDVSRITGGRLELAEETFDLGETVREVLERLREQAARADCQVKLEVVGAVVGRWDRVRIEQVLTNLLSNAIKYAPGAPIEIEVHADDGLATVAIRDHGIGIAVEDQQRIFSRFERAVPLKHYGGLGLGLYIARQILEAHGGAIAVESRPGAGATFQIQLPLEPRETRVLESVSHGQDAR